MMNALNETQATTHLGVTMNKTTTGRNTNTLSTQAQKTLATMSEPMKSAISPLCPIDTFTMGSVRLVTVKALVKRGLIYAPKVYSPHAYQMTNLGREIYEFLFVEDETPMQASDAPYLFNSQSD